MRFRYIHCPGVGKTSKKPEVPKQYTTMSAQDAFETWERSHPLRAHVFADKINQNLHTAYGNGTRGVAGDKVNKEDLKECVKEPNTL